MSLKMTELCWTILMIFNVSQFIYHLKQNAIFFTGRHKVGYKIVTEESQTIRCLNINDWTLIVSTEIVPCFSWHSTFLAFVYKENHLLLSMVCNIQNIDVGS